MAWLFKQLQYKYKTIIYINNTFFKKILNYFLIAWKSISYSW